MRLNNIELRRIAVLIEITRIRLLHAIDVKDASLEQRATTLLLTLQGQFYCEASKSINIDNELASFAIVFDSTNTDGRIVNVSQKKTA